MKLTTLFILFLTVFVTLCGCSGSSSVVMTEEEMAISEELREKFEKHEVLVYGDTLLASKEVLSYYKENEFAPIWISKEGLTVQGDSMYYLVENAMDYGLMPEMYHYSRLEKLVDSSLLDVEMLLSNAFFLFATHVDVGCVDTVSLQYVWKKDSLDYSLEEELTKVREGEPVVAVIESHEPDFWEYRQLKKGLIQYLDLYTLDTNHYAIPAFKDDSVKCYNEAKNALIGHAILDSASAQDDSVFIAKLRDFQLLNGLKDDAVVGKWTGKSLEKSNMDRFYNAAVSMERWRWKQAYPKKYIRVNIPEFTLYFFDNDSLKRKHRVIVGALITQTPEFHATMKTMVTNPFWHVPYSISSTEILVGAKKDSNYFAKKGYKLFKNGETVDPSSVDWSNVKYGNFPYKVRQDGGGGNSLGRLKFLFPNPNFVFIHDTPTKGLFKNDVRAYSHGCIRLDEPYELGKALLQAENHTIHPDTLVSLINKGSQVAIEFKEKFEVFIEYTTVTGDSSGQAIFHPDIYGRDLPYMEHTFKRFSH